MFFKKKNSQLLPKTEYIKNLQFLSSENEKRIIKENRKYVDDKINESVENGKNIAYVDDKLGVGEYIKTLGLSYKHKINHSDYATCNYFIVSWEDKFYE